MKIQKSKTNQWRNWVGRWFPNFCDDHKKGRAAPFLFAVCEVIFILWRRQFRRFLFPFFFGPYAGSNRIPKWRKSKCCVHWAKKNSVKVPKTDSPSPNHAENPIKLGKNSVKE